MEKGAKSLASALLMSAAIFAEILNAKQRELRAAAAPDLNAVRQALKHSAEVFQVSPKAAAVRALLKLLAPDALRWLFPER